MTDTLYDAAVRARFVAAFADTLGVAGAAAATELTIGHARYYFQSRPTFAAECRAAARAAGRPALRNRQRVSPALRATFLTALAEVGSVAAACRDSGIKPQSAYHIRRTDADFAADWADAREQARERIEDKLFEAALGAFEQTTEKDGVVTTRRSQNAAAMFKLLALRRTPSATGGRVIELTPALIASARAKYEAALRLAAETGDLPPPALATLPPPTVSAT